MMAIDFILTDFFPPSKLNYIFNSILESTITSVLIYFISFFSYSYFVSQDNHFIVPSLNCKFAILLFLT